MSSTYFFAAFPGLARNTSTIRENAERYSCGDITREEYDTVDSMKRNEIMNIGLYICGVGQLPLVAIGIGILYALHPNSSTANNNWALSVSVAWTSAYWVILAIPWFILEKRRPGQPLPPGLNYLTAGVWQVYRAAIQIWKLKQSLIYLVVYFFLGDAFNTTYIVVSTLQNEVQEYNIIQITWLSLLSFAAQATGIYALWRIQRRWSFSTKTMLGVVAVNIIAANIWGMIGIWTNAIGYHHRWEFWLWNIWYGGMLCPWYSYSTTMVCSFSCSFWDQCATSNECIKKHVLQLPTDRYRQISEITPRGKMSLFFSLFNISQYISVYNP